MLNEERLDPVLNAGRCPAKFEGREEYSGDLRKVPCTKHEEHIGAEQIFAHTKGTMWYTPTVKHNCPRTILAASIRNTSNKNYFDNRVFLRYKLWFRGVFIKNFLKYMDLEDIEVDLEKWLLKYPVNYRKNIRQSIDRDHISHDGKTKVKYGAFPKIELNVTDVCEDLKDTEANEVKERLICGPSDEKKAWANAFINELEGVASRNMKEYCGRANWIEICKSLDDIEANIPNLIWAASDGSGFDMTQYPEMNKLMNELILACAKHKNVTWKEPLTIDRLAEMLNGSLHMKVEADNGKLRYQAEGRASGDGWTTFGNTMLMISYWQFTAHIAQVQIQLKVKGDDVLFAMDTKDRDAMMQAIDTVFAKKKEFSEHGLGQICKKIDWGDITDLDFLSNEFFRTKEGKIRMTRIPKRVLQTNSWTTKLPPKGRKREDIRRQLCYSKGKCLEAWADGLPIFGALARKMIELGKPGSFSEFNIHSDADRVWYKGRDDYDAYMAYLENRYSVRKDEVLQFERQIAKITSLGEIVENTLIDKFYKC